MGRKLPDLAHQAIVVSALTLGGTALIVCGVGPMRAQGETATTHPADPAWTTPRAERSKSDNTEAGAGAALINETPPAAASHETAHPVIIEDPGGHSLDAFFESLAAVDRAEGTGPLARISCFGDSHTAADFMTGQLRRRMQARFGDGGHGFIAAGRPWPSYRHRNVQNGAQGSWEALRFHRSDEVDGRLGLAGVAIETETSKARAWVATVTEGPVGLQASRFELYYLSHPRGGRLGLHLDDEEVALLSSRSAEPQPAYYRVDAADGPHRFDVETLGQGLVRLFGIVIERPGPGVTVDSLGINGARITAMLGWDEDTFADNLAHRGPDLVVLWYGANSVGDDWYSIEQYEQWVIDALSRIRRAVPEASCLLVGPPDMARASLADHGPSGTPPALHGIIAAQRDAAGLVGCGFFDSFTAMGGENSNIRWAEHDPPLVSGDGIHFTIPGYESIADMLYDALIDRYEQYLEANPES